MNPTSSRRIEIATAGTTSTVNASVLVAGDWRHQEFASIRSLIQRTSHFADLVGAREALLERQLDPGWIVIFESRPGQFSASDVESLVQAAPMAKPIACLGGWNEGETRTGSPWPGVHRIYWHQFEYRFGAILNGEQDQAIASPEFNRTWLTVDETIVRDGQRRLDRDQLAPNRVVLNGRDGLHDSKGLIAIRAVDATTFESFADTCQKFGYAAAWLPAMKSNGATLPRRIEAILWFGDLTSATEVGRLAELHQEAGATPIIAMTHFPRKRDVEVAEAHGAAKVVSLPCWDDDVRQAIASVKSRTHS